MGEASRAQAVAGNLVNIPEHKIPPLKRAAAVLAQMLPRAWRFPICGLSAGECGLEATEPLISEKRTDPQMLRAMAAFFGPDDRPKPELVRSHAVVIPRGIAWSRGANLTADGCVIEPLSVGMNLPMSRWLLKRQRFFPKVRRVPGTVVSLATDGHNNFYHWMLDVLPKLFIALALGLGDERFYVGASTPFQRESLGLFGISPERLIDGNETTFLQAERLIVPFLGERHPPNVFDAAKCRLLVDVFSPFLDRQKPNPKLPPRFVISRAQTRSRRVVNEAELLARLEPLGFRLMHLEDFSFLEQMTLFARAEAIVASTGAGLIHLIQARAGIPVAILMPEECPDLVCQELAAQAGLRSEIFYAERHPRGTPDKIGCDLLLDDDLLARLVKFFA